MYAFTNTIYMQLTMKLSHVMIALYFVEITLNKTVSPYGAFALVLSRLKSNLDILIALFRDRTTVPNLTYDTV